MPPRGLLSRQRSPGAPPKPCSLTQATAVWNDSAAGINQLAYCGYRQARCNGTASLQAWDFQDTNARWGPGWGWLAAWGAQGSNSPARRAAVRVWAACAPASGR